MEDINESEERRLSQHHYSHSQPNPALRMPPADAASLHNYPPPPPGTTMQYSSTAGWHPPPSPYESHDQRPPPQDLSNPHPNAPHPYAPPSREQSVYGPDPSYSRAGSISAPNRSPNDGHHPHFQAVNGNLHESQFQHPPGGADFRPRPGYGPPENPPNGTQTPSLHVMTGHEVMSGHPQPLPPSHYGHPQSAGPHPSPVYPPDYYGQHQMGPYGAGQRRKPVRAAQACDSCRQRKAKCDEGRPECQHCKDNNLKCFYRDVPLQKQDKQAQAMTEKLDTMSENINRMLQIQEEQARQLNMLQSLLPVDKKPGHHAVQHEPVDAAGRTPPVKDEPGNSFQSTPKQISSSAPNQYHENKSDPYTSDEFALPVKHTTAAQNLFSWPSVRILMPKDRPEDYTESYVMDLESKRGLLRLYGCGEGEDKNDGGAGAPSPANSSDSSRNEDEQSGASPRGGVWGTGQLPARSPGPDPQGRDHAGGVSANGGLILDADLVDTFVHSYLANIHILHPFLEIKVLQDMVTRFKRRYSWGYFPPQHRGLSTGKRKRAAEESPGPPSDGSSHNRSYYSGSTGVAEVEHSITNAIILLVLALGKICAHKAPLPGPMSDTSIPTSNPYPTFSELSTSASAPNSPSVHLGVKMGAPGSAISGPTDPRGKNMDVIPGLAYYAVAADILGELPGGGDVSHIQANLLAGLYMGQLARIVPSHFYISNACKACQVLIESSEYKSQTIKPARKNLIKFAFWTCLQLESDILAEVLLPPSGITRYEARMIFEMPNGVTLEPNPDEANPSPLTSHPNIFRILRFYSTQIQLRRTLNDIHSNLYKDKDKEMPYDQKPPLKIIENLNINLETWRSTLGDWNWNDLDHLSPDINVARMRAKYYGAKYIIHRPALRYLLASRTGFGSGSSSTPGSRPSESPVVGPSYKTQHPSPVVQNSQSGTYVARRPTEMAPPNQSSFDKDVQAAAEACVMAAMRSTTVFDHVPQRIIITNIFGTAHA
jgi:Fungal Zn(2)-Cys(6) binuclear cluster domain